MALRPKGAMKKGPARPHKGSFARKELWSVVRQLTPAEGLALVCLTSWVEPETGLARASDRQVCHQTGVSRDVMKRLRRKLVAIGLPVTPGSHLSHDSCSYDFRKVLDVGKSRQLRVAPERAEVIPRMLRVEKAPNLGSNSTEGDGAKSAEPAAEETPSLELEPYAFMSVSKEPAPTGALPAEPEALVGSGRIVSGREQGATPEAELTALPPTAPIWPGLAAGPAWRSWQRECAAGAAR